jgi:hypothetical protein
LALPRGLLVLLSMAGVVVAVAGLRGASGIVGPAFLALMIVITIHPLLAWLQRHRVPGWPRCCPATSRSSPASSTSSPGGSASVASPRSRSTPPSASST